MNSRGAGQNGTPEEWSPFDVWSPGKDTGSFRSLFSRADALLLFLCALLLFWFGWRMKSLPPYQWQWSLLTEFMFRRDILGNWEPGPLLRGLGMTLRIGAWSMLLALFSGGLAGLYAAHRHGLAALPVRAYINLARNTPPLVLLFLIYFFSGSLLPISAIEGAILGFSPEVQGWISGIFAPPGQMDRMIPAVLALGLYEGAYVAEIVRGGVESVPRRQWEASAALGFSFVEQLYLVILPQAVRTILPPLAGQTISAFKDSALASLISLPELTFQSMEIMAVSRMTFEIWLSAAFLYLVLGVACARFSHYLERRQTWRA